MSSIATIRVSLALLGHSPVVVSFGYLYSTRIEFFALRYLRFSFSRRVLLVSSRKAGFRITAIIASHSLQVFSTFFLQIFRFPCLVNEPFPPSRSIHWPTSKQISFLKSFYSIMHRPIHQMLCSESTLTVSNVPEPCFPSVRCSLSRKRFTYTSRFLCKIQRSIVCHYNKTAAKCKETRYNRSSWHFVANGRSITVIRR